MRKRNLNSVSSVARKILHLSLCFTMIMSTMLFQTKDVSAATSTLVKETVSGWKFDPDGIETGTPLKLSINGNQVFCLDPFTNYGTSYTNVGNSFEEYSASLRNPISNDMIKRLSLITYYGTKVSGRTSQDWFSITQALIWKEITGTSRHYIFSNTAPNKATLESKFAEILADVENYYVKPSFSNTINPLKVGESITLTDTNGVLDGYVVSAISEGLTYTKSGNTLTVTAVKYDADPYIDFKRNIPAEMTKSSIAWSCTGRQLIGELYILDPLTGFVEFDIINNGNIEIAKQDNKGNMVPNTTFAISRNSNMSNPIGTYTTGTNGKVLASDLSAGTYYIQEKSVPSHLTLDSTIRSIEVKAGETATYTATNDWVQGYIQVTKKDAKTGQTVLKAGTQFEILSGSTVVSTITTNASGVARSGLLDYGTYIVREKLAPTNYQIVNTTQTQGITTQGATYELTFFNEPVSGSISLTKVDSENKTISSQGDATLIGAKYLLRAKTNIFNPATGEVLFSAGETISVKTVGNSTWGDVGVKVTNVSSEIKWANLPLGNYELLEIEAPEGYLVNSNVQSISLTYSNQNQVADSFNAISEEQVIKGQVRLVKSGHSGDSGLVEGLEGVEFTFKLYSEVLAKGWDNAKTYDVVTTDDEGVALSKSLPYGIYQVRETKVPDDYAVGEDFLVNVSEDGKVYTRIVNNVPFEAWLKLVKVDNEGKEVTLSNATFKLLDQDGNVVKQKVAGVFVDTFTTDHEGKVILPQMLEKGVYSIVEIQTPEGFLIGNDVEVVISSLNTSIELDGQNDAIITVTIVNEKPTGTIILDKIFENMNPNKDYTASFELYAKTEVVDPATGEIIYEVGQLVGTYTLNDDLKVVIEGLPLGTHGATYELREVSTTPGYVVSTESLLFTFEIEDNTTKVYTSTSSLENKLTETDFAKVDVNSASIKGATLQVIDQDGNIIDEWVSNGENHVIKGLEFNKQYIYKELNAPKGYVLATDILFSITENNQSITMIDKVVAISKQDVTTGKELPGATLQVIDQDGNIIDEWVSTDTPHYVSGLVEGETYTLREMIAPNGFVVAEEIVFTVSYEKEVQKVTMVDKVVTISKQDITTGKELPGATLQVIDQDGNIIDEWVSTDTPHYVSGLVEGETYTLREITAPYGYYLAEDIEFTVTYEKEVQRVVMYDQQILTNIVVNKVDSMSGNAVVSKDFVFGIYADADCTVLIEKKNANTEDGTVTFENMPYGTYYIKELEAPEGYKVSNEIVKVVIDDNLEEAGKTYSFKYLNTLLPEIIVTNPETSDKMFGSLISNLLLFVVSGFGVLTLSKQRKEDKA